MFHIRHPIYDLRAEHYHTKGLFAKKRIDWPDIKKNTSIPPKNYREICAKLGRESIKNSTKYIIDVCGLSEPFLSRIPAVRLDNWKIGHHYRKIPTGYGEFLVGKIDELPDLSLNPFVNDISLLTSGSLVSMQRFFRNLARKLWIFL